MKRIGLAAIAWILICGSRVVADCPRITFTKIADTETPVPGWNGTFQFFSDDRASEIPSCRNGNVAFIGYPPASPPGAYGYINGNLVALADRNITVPSGNGAFHVVHSVAIDEAGHVAFVASVLPSPLGPGLYSNVRGPLALVVGDGGPAPEGQGIFGTIQTTAISGDNILFFAGSTASSQGIFGRFGTTLSTIVDQNTPIPGGVGNFAELNPLAYGISGDNVAFWGRGQNGAGIYSNIPGRSVIADQATPIPGWVGTFSRFDPVVSVSGENVAFRGGGAESGGMRGIYAKLGESIVRIADSNTLTPDASGRFGFDDAQPWLSISGRRVAFMAHGNRGLKGIYLWNDGELCKIIDRDDRLDGKRINYQDGLMIGSTSLDGRWLAFHAALEDGTFGIFLAEIADCNEPRIIVQPSAEPICEGRDIVLSVAADGSEPLRYQWRRYGVSLPGATGATYILDTAMFGDSGNYDVEVSNACGSVISDTAVVIAWPHGTGDVNGDRRVNGLDVATMVDVIRAWPDGPEVLEFCAADMNFDGQVDFEDVRLLVDVLVSP